jgi:hypothetical protein
MGFVMELLSVLTGRMSARSSARQLFAAVTSSNAITVRVLVGEGFVMATTTALTDLMSLIAVDRREAASKSMTTSSRHLTI